jgi:peptidoglycan/LPS O-acetylase OafA/YrhL
MTAPQPRPRVVTVAFWCWVVASVLLVAFGMLLALSSQDLPVLFRGAGALFALSGLGLGYLSGRARLGQPRFRRAAVALALAIVVILALFALMSRGPVWLLVMIVTMVGAVLMMRPSAQDWFDREETQ